MNFSFKYVDNTVNAFVVNAVTFENIICSCYFCRIGNAVFLLKWIKEGVNEGITVYFFL